MEMRLSDNIRSFRKQRRLTQEQLAEVLGVTTGAVYKWESGLSVPELELIVEMADFFDTSVDALLGYQMKDNRPEAAIRRMNEYCRNRDPRALDEAEKALKKYPNSFDVVHSCAQTCLLFGVGDRAQARRGLELLEQARLLLAQNADPRISELSLIGETASAYHMLGETEKGLELLKQHNTEGIFSDTIGSCLALYLRRTEEAEPFLSEALMRSALSLVTSIAGYSFVFFARKDYPSARSILQWGIQALRELKNETATDFTDKVFAELLVALAHAQRKTGQADQARSSLEQAWELARQFDAAPDYGLESLRFVSVPESVSVYDSMGATAAEGVENILRLLDDPELSDAWKEVSGRA